MEGANKNNINLESGLDISTSDMLVPFGQQTFQHNWQRYQGKFLPNSLRFEKNGWAAGWNVYNFDYNTYRSEQHGYSVGLGQFNIYVKALNIYDSEDSYNSIHTVYVIPDSVVTVGDLSINGNVISGKVKDKNFQLIWDPVTHLLSCSDPTIGLTQVINSDYSIAFIVKDLSSSFKFDFNLLFHSELTGDAITGINYSGFRDNEHSWGQYTYNINTGILTTPEGVAITPTVSENEIAFDYTQAISDETMNITYVLSKFYPRFSKITYQDQTNKNKLLIAVDSSEKLPFNRYSASVTPKTLNARDENGVLIDWQLPLWITAKLGVNRVNPTAKKCDNTNNYEIATTQGYGLNMGGTYKNIWSGGGTFSIADVYRKSFEKYLWNIPYRFNQIVLKNTITRSPNWDFRKHLLKSQVWYADSRKYANIRGMRSADMTKLLGDVYTWGTFYLDPSIMFSYNDPYDISDKDSCFYKKEDISQILSFRLAGTDDNTDEGEDQSFIDDNITGVDEKLIATFSGTVMEYSSGLPANIYTNLYTNGVYTGTTYETVGVSEAPFWPFEKVPKFNYKDDSGVVHRGVYWTDGVNIVDNLNVFKDMVLGPYDDTVDRMNTVIVNNALYNRTRIVSQYAAGYDFDFIKKSSYEQEQDYVDAVDVWNKIWKKYYPDTPSPQDTFDEEVVSNDETYFNFNDITINKGVDPQIRYVKPGVYFYKKYAVLYDCPSGLIIYDDSSGYSLSANIWHHAVQVDSQYVLNYQHEYGIVTLDNGVSMNIPFYFGSASREELVAGAEGHTYTPDIIKVELKSAKLTIGVNYNCVLVRHVKHDSDGSWEWYTWEWVRVPAKNTNWLGGLLASYTKDYVRVYDLTTNAGVEPLGKYYFVGDINSGIKVACPVWGHSQTRLVYPEVKDSIHINDDDAFAFEPVPTAELADTGVIYFDRDDTVKSQKLFEVVENARLPDSGKDSGNFTLKLKSVNDGFMYYAKKQYNARQEEITADYYIPGVAWGSPEDGTGFLATTSQSPILELDWVPSVSRFPVNVIEKFSDNNTKYSQHILYTKDKSLIDNANCTLGEIDFENLTQDITISFPYGDYILHYNGDSGVTTGNAGQPILQSATEDVRVALCYGTTENIEVPLFINLNYKNNRAKFIKTSNSTLLSSDSDRCVITDGTNEITYSINQQNVIIPDNGVNTFVEAIPNGQHIIIEGNSQNNYTCYLKAVYDGVINGTQVSFTWNDLTFNWDLSQQIDTGISVLSTDIRKPEKTNIIGKLKTEGQYQLLRQQWNTTVEVENYWWIDATHVLELNQYSLVLKRNTKELDDWNGERFEKVFEIGRDKILPTNITRYFTTNVYKSSRSALFVTAQEDFGSALLTFYNPRKAFEIVGTQRIRVRQRDIGQQLNDITIDGSVAVFNSYNPITVEQLLSKAEWSHTIVGNWMIIGCHLGNNYDQWALVINLTNNTLTRCLQGYGYVGLHGDLTGGQIPTDYFDADIGFNDTVQPLSVLKSSDQDLNNLDAAYEVGSIDRINRIDAKVVGTSEQQWYISKKVYGIVSHLTFSDGNFTKQLLPITNNFASVYKSPSFSSSVFADSFVQGSPFESMFSFDGAAKAAWRALITLIGYPVIYSIAPRFAQLVYLQQTFGQYAYVHYNSSKSLPEQGIDSNKTDSGISENKNKQTDPVLSSSFTFDKQKFTQNETTELGYYNNIVALLIASFADSIQYIDKKVSMNEEVNTSSIKDAGRKFVDNAAANTGDMLAAAIVSQSKNDSGVTSAVTGIKSLDMFYSTCDQQRVFAGPGYVEHQFVADCVAQSVTDVQVEGKVQQFYFCIRALTTLQLTTTIALENLAADALDKAADATAAQMVCGTSLGAVAVAMHTTAAAMRAAIKTQEVALNEAEKILDAICAKGLTVNIDGQVSRHALSVEGKHKYGEKNEVFMWPCFGVQPGQIKYTDEWVECGVRNTPWTLTLKSAKGFSNGLLNMCNVIMGWHVTKYSSNKMGSESEAVANCGTLKAWKDETGEKDFDKPGDTYRAYYMYGNVPFYQASAIGKAEERTLPDDMAKVEGVVRFLPNEPFKNENIGQSDPAFAPSMIHDYIIDKSWDLAQCCSYGLQQWVTVKDTKITNCPPSNIVIADSFCGIACPYTVIEVKRGIEKAYMRPWAVTPNTLALNCTGFNTILDNKLYHAFDGISYRLVDLVGSPGMNKNRQSFWYAFQVNDRFKRSNIAPANEMQGNFESEPVQAAATIDKMWTTITVAAKEKGMEAGTIGEDKDAIRWAVPVFTEQVSTLPAAVKTMAASTLAVVEGVTSLVTAQVTDTNSAYKAPLSVDFTIGKNVYRATEEYICSVTPAEAGNIITDLIPSLGLKYIGATPTEAFFYSKSTRCYYSFTGAALTKMDMMERFRDIQKGYWDFVNQEVVMPCLMTFKRLNEEVEDKDTETDNIIIPVLSKGQVSGELPPPITTIFNDRSWYKCVSLPCGFAYQGPNRVIINRSVFVEYMLDTMKANIGKWSKMDREKYVTHREYHEKYDNIMKDVNGVDGWTYNPFVLVTSALGNSEDTDCLYEWNITFCWPIEMDLLYGTDNYACVNIVAETMTPGGKVKSRPTHVFLTKELFTRNGNYGYYSFRFQSKNGAGNRERLHIWSDQYIAISSINCESKVVTSRRTEQLTQQIDVQKLKEL